MTNLRNHNNYLDNWCYKKHHQHIIVETIGSNVTAFWNKISKIGNYPMIIELDEEFIFNWHGIKPHYKMPFDYLGCEKEIEKLLHKSLLSKHKYVLLDTKYSDPIFKVDSNYFIKNWDDFISANQGMGSIVCSEDFSLLMEFTNDHSYMLYSNFLI